MAAKEDRPRRVDLGFAGGQVLSLRMGTAEYESLTSGLERGDGWHELETQDSKVRIHLGQVVYTRIDTEEQKVGF